MRSEELIAYELGYRAQPSERFSWDVALFYNVYENLRSRRVTGVNSHHAADDSIGVV